MWEVLQGQSEFTVRMGDPIEKIARYFWYHPTLLDASFLSSKFAPRAWDVFRKNWDRLEFKRGNEWGETNIWPEHVLINNEAPLWEWVILRSVSYGWSREKFELIIEGEKTWINIEPGHVPEFRKNFVKAQHQLDAQVNKVIARLAKAQIWFMNPFWNSPLNLGKHRKIYCKREIRVNLSLLLYLLTQEY